MTSQHSPDQGERRCFSELLLEACWAGARDTALQMPDLPAPRVRLPCCTCDVGAERKRLFLRSVLRTVGTKNGL